MRLRLFRMGIEGKIAVANLALIGCALCVVRASISIRSEGWRAASAVAEVAVAVLGFPVGWISVLGGDTGGSEMVLILGAIFLPLNAYLWGYVVAAVVRRCRQPRNAFHGAADGRKAIGCHVQRIVSQGSSPYTHPRVRAPAVTGDPHDNAGSLRPAGPIRG